jgi:hypothetical protein
MSSTPGGDLAWRDGRRGHDSDGLTRTDGIRVGTTTESGGSTPVARSKYRRLPPEAWTLAYRDAAHKNSFQK